MLSPPAAEVTHIPETALVYLQTLVFVHAGLVWPVMAGSCPQQSPQLLLCPGSAVSARGHLCLHRRADEPLEILHSHAPAQK